MCYIVEGVWRLRLYNTTLVRSKPHLIRKINTGISIFDLVKQIQMCESFHLYKAIVYLFACQVMIVLKFKAG